MGKDTVVKNPKCHNCKHASGGFKIAGSTHHQCIHPKHQPGFESGELSAWDTLRTFYDTCESHEFVDPPLPVHKQFN